MTGESIPVGRIVSKTERIKVSGIHSGSMEPSFRALPSDSCQAAMQSDTQRETVGQRKEVDRERGRNSATAMLIRPAAAESESGLSERKENVLLINTEKHRLTFCEICSYAIKISVQ